MSNRVQLTAWGNDDYKAMLDNIVKKKGYRSMSEAILALITDENDRQNDKDKVDDVANIYKVIALVSQGKVFPDADAIRAFLKGGSN